MRFKKKAFSSTNIKAKESNKRSSWLISLSKLDSDKNCDLFKIEKKINFEHHEETNCKAESKITNDIRNLGWSSALANKSVAPNCRERDSPSK